jgi:glycerophosphoryl diester phosphodiesterase
MRATYLKALLREGSTSVEQVRREDPGSALIAPLLRVEHVFRNAVDVGELAYAAIDGHRVPQELIERVPIPAGAEVVFASDGYPAVLPTCVETEDYLSRSLSEDPLRIGRHPEVRGVKDGWESYDDRAYLRFSLAE